MINIKLDKKAKNIISKTADFSGGGGTKVVTELPDVGEEHIVYELRESKPADFPWLLTEFDRGDWYLTINRPFVVIETEEQNTQEYLRLDGDTNCFVYVKTTNKVYSWTMGEDSYIVEEIVPEDYIYYDRKYTFAILKDFDYHVTDTSKGQEPTRKPAIILDGTGHFLDGTEFNYENGSDVIPLVLTEAKNPIYLFNSLVGCANCKDINNTSELPTAKQAVDGNMCNSKGFVAYPTYISLQNKLVYGNEPSTDTYSWNSEFQYFVNLEVEDVPENPAHYYGPLEWNTFPLTVVNKIDLSLDLGKRVYIFAPQQAHTEITYWIYSNNTWTNVDDIGKPVEQEVVYGELLKGDTFDEDRKLISPYTNEQICKYIIKGKPVILRYHSGYMSENEFMFVCINGFDAAEMADEYVNQYLYYNNFTCNQSPTSDRIEYDYESDYFYYWVGEE